MNNIRTLIEKSVERFWVGPVRRWYKRYKNWKYSKFEAGYIFQIDNDGLKFEMTFLDYCLGTTIIERIEGVREIETVAIQKSLVRPGDSVLELGGCYGYFTTILSRCAGPNGKVVSIEGTPNNFRILQENIRLNNLLNVNIYNCFITSLSEKVGFDVDDTGPYKAIETLTKKLPSTNHEISVPSIRLSSFLMQIDFIPDHIFMDIEGFEVEVFDDFSDSKYFEKYCPNIVFEVHNQFYQKGKGIEYILHILEANDYCCRKIAGNMLCLPSKV